MGLQDDARKDAREWHYVFASLGLFVCGLGIVSLYVMYDELTQGWQSSDWPTTNGRVDTWVPQSEIVSRKRGEAIFRYFPLISYRYTVDGKEYTGSRFHFSPSMSSELAEVEKWLHAARRAEEVTVHFNPDDPAVSVIVPGVSVSRYIFCITLVIAAIGGPIFAAYQFRRAKRLS